MRWFDSPARLVQLRMSVFGGKADIMNCSQPKAGGWPELAGRIGALR